MAFGFVKAIKGGIGVVHILIVILARVVYYIFVKRRLIFALLAFLQSKGCWGKWQRGRDSAGGIIPGRESIEPGYESRD
ncbi:hypothetical protein CVS37_32170 [Burkholderia lata]|nr:hypothetical protein CVS37_32170 [Burkholderia lata]